MNALLITFTGLVELWTQKMGFRSVSEWWYQTIKSHCEKKIPIGLAVRIDLLKNVGPLCRPTKVGSHAVGGIALHTSAWTRQGFIPVCQKAWSFTKILEDGRIMRKVCVVRKWKQPDSFVQFPLVYIQNIINLFIFIIITISSSSANVWQNSLGCYCLWSGPPFTNVV